MSKELMAKYHEHRRFLMSHNIDPFGMPEDPDPEDVYSWCVRWMEAQHKVNTDLNLKIIGMMVAANPRIIVHDGA